MKLGLPIRSRLTSEQSTEVATGRRRRRVTGWLLALGVIVLASLVVGGGMFLASVAYAQFGAVKAPVSARSWASRTLSYRPTACASCHAVESQAQAANTHAGLDCETCHGPLGTHPGSDPTSIAVLAKPTSAICVTCHAQTQGRRVSFPQVDPATHYSGGACLQCHDPHSVVAVAPPQVPHPLTDLPACTTCHAPDGLKKLPAGHEPAADAVCLSCHSVLRPQP